MALQKININNLKVALPPLRPIDILTKETTAKAT